MRASFVRGLKCRLCGATSPVSTNNACPEDFGPLEVDYDYDAVADALSRQTIERRPRRGTGCCGFDGPIPSATLDKIAPTCQVQ